MTPIERAEKIINSYGGNPFHNAGQAHAWLIATIAAQIEEAEREAEKRGYNEGFHTGLPYPNYEAGFTAAREMARKVLLDQEYRYRSNEFRKEYIALSATESLIRALEPTKGDL